MPFEINDFAPIHVTNGIRMFSYNTDDAFAAISGTNYFDEVNPLIGGISSGVVSIPDVVFIRLSDRFGVAQSALAFTDTLSFMNNEWNPTNN